MSMKVFRKNVTKSKSFEQVAEQQHILSLYFGRYKVVAKFQHKYNSSIKEDQYECPTQLYYYRNIETNTYQLKMQYKQDSNMKIVKIDPFFDGYIDDLCIGDEKQHDMITVNEIIEVYLASLLEKQITRNQQLNVVYSTFSSDDGFNQLVANNINGFLMLMQSNFTIQQLKKQDLFQNSKYQLIVQQDKSIFNQTTVDIGTDYIYKYIDQTARDIFGETLHEQFFSKFIETNKDQNFGLTNINIHIPIPQCDLKLLHKSHLYNKLKQFKDKQSLIYIQTRNGLGLTVIISRVCIYNAQVSFAEELAKKLDIKQLNRQFMNEMKFSTQLPDINKPVLVMYEENDDQINSQILKQQIEKLVNYEVFVQCFAGPEIIEFGIQSQSGKSYRLEEVEKFALDLKTLNRSGLPPKRRNNRSYEQEPSPVFQLSTAKQIIKEPQQQIQENNINNQENTNNIVIDNANTLSDQAVKQNDDIITHNQVPKVQGEKEQLTTKKTQENIVKHKTIQNELEQAKTQSPKQQIDQLDIPQKQDEKEKEQQIEIVEKQKNQEPSQDTDLNKEDLIQVQPQQGDTKQVKNTNSSVTAIQQQQNQKDIVPDKKSNQIKPNDKQTKVINQEQKTSQQVDFKKQELTKPKPQQTKNQAIKQ